MKAILGFFLLIKKNDTLIAMILDLTNMFYRQRDCYSYTLKDELLQQYYCLLSFLNKVRKWSCKYISCFRNISGNFI